MWNWNFTFVIFIVWLSNWVCAAKASKDNNHRQQTPMGKNCMLIEQDFVKKEWNYTNEIERMENLLARLKQDKTEYQELKRKCGLMKIKEAGFKTREEYFTNETEIFIQKEEDYQSEVDRLKTKIKELEMKITAILNGIFGGNSTAVGILTAYTIEQAKRSWDASNAYCNSTGGTLAVITNLKEQKYLMKATIGIFPPAKQMFWIGALKPEYSVKDWEWVTHEFISRDTPYIWTHASGFYNDGCLALHPEDFRNGPLKHGGFRGHGRCDHARASICEKTLVNPVCFDK